MPSKLNLPDTEKRTPRAAPGSARRSRLNLPKAGAEPVAVAPQLPGVGDILTGVVKDTAEGAVGPFVAGWETAASILSDPRVGLLPAAEQQAHQAKAGDAAIKGAAFWGSMLVGGPIAGLPMRTLFKMGLMGAASASTFEAIRKLPDVYSKQMTLADWTKDVSTAATFGALTGGVLSKTPEAIGAATKFAGATNDVMMGAARRVVDAIPGGKPLREAVATYARKAHAQLWHPLFTSGVEVLKKSGLVQLAIQLLETRAGSAILGGKYVAGFLKNIRDLDGDEMMMMGKMLDKIDFRNIENDPLAQRVLRAGSPRTEEIFQRAWAESERLRAMGEALQKAGVQTFHPDSGEFHQFILRDRYLPHRFVNPEKFLEDGPIRKKAIEAVMNSEHYMEQDAADWVDRFALRVKDENERFFTDPTRFRSGSSHYAIGRHIGLPGYETNVSKILPQYYDAVARRLVAHAMFGPTNVTEQALQKSLLQKGEAGERLAAVEGEPGFQAAVPEGQPTAEQLQLFPTEEMMAGRGVPKTRLEPHQPQTVDEILLARRIENLRNAKRNFSVEQRFPRAFAQLESVEDPQMKKLATTILRRQLGAIEATPYGEETLSKLAKLEVITKLALGAIAQPSQMLSGIVRTGWRGAFRNMMKAMAGDPEALDFAMRTGAILRSVVRESEQSLTGGETDFLKKVLFTQFDMKSRVFGALQGASYAEYMGTKLASLLQHPERFGAKRAIEKIEEKFVGLGLNPAEIAKRGGTLTQDELLRAGQTVAMDVNFWGDSLSLPAFFRSPYGRFLTQFKSFGFQQTKLIKDHVVKPAAEWARSGGKRGDIGPLTRFALTMPAGGEIISDLKKFARQRKRTDVPFERVAENVANGAGFGLAWDAFDATKYGMSGSLGFMGGPILGTAAKGWTAVGSAARGSPEKLVRFGIETGLPAATAILVPGALPAVAAAAPAIANIVQPPPGQ
jgi:hypothetical protein